MIYHFCSITNYKNYLSVTLSLVANQNDLLRSHPDKHHRPQLAGSSHYERDSHHYASKVTLKVSCQNKNAQMGVFVLD